MMYTRNDEVLNAYFNSSTPEGSNYQGSLFFEGQVLYSYGRHFPLAVRINRGGGHMSLYIINGDKYSVTTSHHQGMLFSYINNSQRLEIPFSALEAAFSDVRITWLLRNQFEIIDWQFDQLLDTGRIDKNGNKLFEHVLGASVFKVADEYYLSGLDESGTGQGLYFLTKLLPGQQPTTVQEAYEFMKPDAVKRAEEENKTIYRQGEFFFVEANQNEIPKEYHKPEKKNDYNDKYRFLIRHYYIANRDRDRDNRHYATYGYVSGDKQYVYGTVRHVRNEHRMVRLYRLTNGIVAPSSKTWFEVHEALQQISYSAIGAID